MRSSLSLSSQELQLVFHIIHRNFPLKHIFIRYSPLKINTDFRKWLHDCGFKVTEIKKKFYFDGHERPDVVLDRERFHKEMEEAKKKTDRINDISWEEIPCPGSTHVRVSQDEKVHHSNDIQTR